MSKRTASTPLADRLAELSISADELAAIIRRPQSEVCSWVDGDAEPDADGSVLLRVLNNDHVATLAAQKVRHTVTRDYRSEGARTAGIEAVPPYGGGAYGGSGEHHGKTGGRPQ